ncbi:hypothetical protein [Celeribacter sp.]|uniref:hypothetical protein n=1 Tax=Celeribacter sp. TaxID=1890673 RepID=UPI003A94B32D
MARGLAQACSGETRAVGKSLACAAGFADPKLAPNPYARIIQSLGYGSVAAIPIKRLAQTVLTRH